MELIPADPAAEDVLFGVLSLPTEKPLPVRRAGAVLETLAGMAA